MLYSFCLKTLLYSCLRKRGQNGLQPLSLCTDGEDQFLYCSNFRHVMERRRVREKSLMWPGQIGAFSTQTMVILQVVWTSCLEQDIKSSLKVTLKGTMNSLSTAILHHSKKELFPCLGCSCPCEGRVNFITFRWSKSFFSWVCRRGLGQQLPFHVKGNSKIRVSGQFYHANYCK